MTTIYEEINVHKMSADMRATAVPNISTSGVRFVMIFASRPHATHFAGTMRESPFRNTQFGTGRVVELRASLPASAWPLREARPVWAGHAPLISDHAAPCSAPWLVSAIAACEAPGACSMEDDSSPSQSMGARADGDDYSTRSLYCNTCCYAVSCQLQRLICEESCQRNCGSFTKRMDDDCERRIHSDD